jgi:hypothetical protein
VPAILQISGLVSDEHRMLVGQDQAGQIEAVPCAVTADFAEPPNQLLATPCMGTVRSSTPDDVRRVVMAA